MILAGDFIPKNLKVHLPDEFRGKLVLANLEGPICADGLPKSNKVGVCLHSNVEKLGSWGVERFAFSLANNHMMDFREEGLRQTKSALSARGIPFAGAGDNEEEARKPMILEENGKRIAVFCCCERQFGMATPLTAGCAEKGVWLYNAIREVKANRFADFVIVSCHAASEFSPWVSPVLREFYHSLVDAGADCIHGHHAHVPQGYEAYRGRPIFFGLGNFVVDASFWSGNSHYQWSLAAKVCFEHDSVKWSVHSFSVARDDSLIRVTALPLERWNRYLEAVNSQFLSYDDLVGCWQEASCRLFKYVYSQIIRSPAVVPFGLTWRDRMRKLFFAGGDIVRALIGREHITSKSLFYGKCFYNAFNCESHMQMIQMALGVFTGVVPDLRTKKTAAMAIELGLRY